MSVNASRKAQAETVSNALDGARLIAYNDVGEACVWFGGYTFNVFDAARDWGEVRVFSSGDLAPLTDYDSEEAYECAKNRMRSEGFTVVE